MTIEEMVTVFRHLPDGRKRLLLEHEYGIEDEVQVTKQPNIYRNILSIIATYIDLSTFGRLKQVCTDFNRYLVEYHELTKIRRYYDGNGSDPVPVQEMTNMFPACAMRLKRLLERVLGKELECEPTVAVRLRAQKFHTRLPWWHITREACVRYPFGYICKGSEAKKPRGHIFQLNPMECFVINYGCAYLLAVKKMTSTQKEDKKRWAKMI